MPLSVDTPRELFAAVNSAAITPSDTLSLQGVKAFAIDPNGIRVTALSTGTGGNAVTLDIAAPDNESEDIAVDVTGDATVVTLAATGTRAVLDAQGILFESVVKGTGANDITVEYAHPGTASASASVAVTGSAIKVNLATDAGSKSTLTNQGITYTAVEAGAGGNDITVAITNPGTPSEDIDVSVSGDAITVSLSTGPGTQQVETATVVGTIGASGAGNATVIVTSAGMSGSPITLNVAVANNDTASQVATKIRAALTANGTIAARFDVSGSAAIITLTKQVASANDATLNISIANGTCTGLTTAATSANTTAGVAPAITTTRNDLHVALLASDAAMALVSVTDPDSDTAVTAVSATNLAGGGASPAAITTRQQARALLLAESDVTDIVFVSVSDVNPLRALIDMSATNLSGGSVSSTSTVQDVINALNADGDFDGLAVASCDSISLSSNLCQPTGDPTQLAGGVGGSWSIDAGFTRALSVNADGNVAFLPFNSSASVTMAVKAGVMYPISATKILSTGTTATGVVGHI